MNPSNSTALVPYEKPLEGEYIPKEEFHVASRIKPLQSRAEVSPEMEGITIQELVDKHVPNKKVQEHVSVRLNGVFVSRRWWKHIRPKAKSLIEIVLTRGDTPTGRAILHLVILVLIVIFAPEIAVAIGGEGAVAYTGGSFTFGNFVYYATHISLAIGSGLLINAILPPPEPDERDSRDLAYFRGAGNRYRLHQPVARLIGKHRMAPDLATTFYTDIEDGTRLEIAPRRIIHRQPPTHASGRQYSASGNIKQTSTIVVCWGYGPVRLSNIRLGDSPIEDLIREDEQKGRRGSDASFQVEHIGVFGDAELPLNTTWNLDSNLVSGDIFQEAVGKRLATGETITVTSATNARYVDLVLGAPTGFHGTSVSGGDAGKANHTTADHPIRRALVTITPEGIEVGDYHLIFGRELRAKSVRPLRWTIRDWLSDSYVPADYVPNSNQYWSYTLLRTQRENTRLTDNNILYIHDIKTYQTGSLLKFDKAAYSVFRFRANEDLRGTIPEINAEVEAYIPSYNPQTRTWDKLRPSANPADAMYEVLRSSATARQVPESDINLNSLREFWTHCNDNDYRFNHIIRQSRSVWQTAQTICRVGFASAGRIDSKWGVIIDREQAVPRQLFTPRNTSNYQLQKVYGYPPHAVRVKFLNAVEQYKGDEVIYYASGYDVDSASEYVSVQLPGITDAAHAWLLARFYLEQRLLRSETHSFTADLDYLTASRGDLIHLQQDSIGVGHISCRIVEVYKNDANQITGFSTDADLDYTIGTSFAARIRSADNSQYTYHLNRVEINGNLIHAQAELTTPAPTNSFQKGNLVAFGVPESVTIPLIISEVKPQRDFTAVLDCVAYNPDLYNPSARPTFDPRILPHLFNDYELPVPRIYARDVQGTFGVTSSQAGTRKDYIQLAVAGPPTTAVRIARLEVAYAKYDPDVGDSEYDWTYVVVSPLSTAVAVGPVDTPVTHEERTGVLRQLETGYSPDFTYLIRARYELVDGTEGDWSPILYHTRTGEALEPPAPENFLLDILGDGTRRFRWQIPEWPHIGGYIIRYSTDFTHEFSDMQNLHRGIHTHDHLETIDPQQPNSYRFGIVTVDRSGAFSDPVYLSRDLSQVTINRGDVSYWDCPSSRGWPGTINGAIRSDDVLDALLGIPDYTWGDLTSWSTWDSWVAPGGLEYPTSFTYITEVIDLRSLIAGSIYWAADLEAPENYLDSTPFELGSLSVAVRTSEDALDPSGSWEPLDVTVPRLFRKFQLRFTRTGSGAAALFFDHLCIGVRAPEAEEFINDSNTAHWGGSVSAGRIVPKNLSYVVQVNLVLQNVGPGYSWEVISKNPTTVIKIYDSSGTTVDATVDVFLKGTR